MDVTRPLRRHASGVTLIELVTTSAVFLIVTAVAVPAYSQFQVVQETASATNAVVTSLAHARHYAVTHQANVVVCPSLDSIGCSDDIDWSRGWISFVDADDDRTRDMGERRIQVSNAASDRVRIVTFGRTEIVYRPHGMTAGTTATFRICNARDPDRRRAVIVNISGRARISKRDAAGDHISCD